jgi:acylphosphatase
VAEDTQRATVYVHGDVQGVGFRFWVRAQARDLGLAGYARNLPDGRVEVVAQGNAEAVERLVALMEENPSTAGRPGSVSSVVTERGTPDPGIGTFEAR